MIASLTGKVDTLFPTSLIIDVAGVGYLVTTTQWVLARAVVGEPIKVYTHQSVTENKISLYGFEQQVDVSFFEMLTSVSGIGPKAGIALLNLASQSELALAIVTEDVDMIKRASGIGAKTAARLVVDLKDKLKKIIKDTPPEQANQISISAGGSNQYVVDATDALLALGYQPKAVYEVVSKLAKEADTTEAIIKLALKSLSSV